jgi:hypothetical protein
VGEFDGDGLWDLVVQTPYGTLLLYSGNGSEVSSRLPPDRHRLERLHLGVQPLGVQR